jgi:PAS domain S-box-containing protein
MTEFFRNLFASDFMPHGVCFLWNPGVLWLHAISDTIIAVSYYLIPLALVYFVWRRKDLPFNWIFVMFGVFIFGCGTTHLMDVWTLWHGTYRLAGIVKAVTAAASVVTAGLLVYLLPQAIALPSPEQLRRANHDLEREIGGRRKADAALKRAHDELELRVRERTAELASAHESLRVLTEVIPQHIWSSTPDGVFDYFNRQLLEYVGRTMDDLQGTRLLDSIHPEDRDRLWTLWRTSLADGRRFAGEWRIRGADGQYRWFFTRGLPVHDAEGRITRWYGTSTDVEDRRQAAQAVLNMQAELAHVVRVTTMGELASSIAHEVNQPLMAVVTNANACLRWLAHEPPDMVEARDSLGRILRDGQRAGEVVGRIRLLLKKTPPKSTDQDVNELIREVLTLLRDTLTSHDISAGVELGSDLPRVLGDRVQLQQVILNLVMNGVEAMSEVVAPRRLLVSSQTLDTGGVSVTVADSGVGVDPAVFEKLFDPFFTTKPGGMGMGLAVCRSIIERHGGHLWASTNEDRGATFHVALPALA